VEFATRNVPLKSGGIVKAQIWDTAGQERYQAITAAHYKRARGAIIVYDITKSSTFNNVKKWMDALKANSEPDIIIMLVGNKLDLVSGNPKERKVPREVAEKFATEQKMLFDETSAVSNVKVKESFEVLMEAIYNEQSKVTNKKSDVGSGLSLSNQPAAQQKKSCCS
jgi:small GTP-binding protein